MGSPRITVGGYATRRKELLFWRGASLLLLFWWGASLYAVTLQSIAVCSNAAGEYEYEYEYEYVSRRGVHPFSFKRQAEEVCAK